MSRKSRQTPPITGDFLPINNSRKKPKPPRVVVGVGQGRRAGKGEGKGRVGQGMAGADGQDGGKLVGGWWMVSGEWWMVDGGMDDISVSINCL